MKKRRKKSKALKLTEYSFAWLIITTVRIVPLHVVRAISHLLGDLLFFASKRRRNIAIENLTHAFGDGKTPDEIRHMARQSCRSIVFTFLEIIKLRYLFANPATAGMIREHTRNIEDLFRKAKKIHDESNGCIFVTPHLGNWEMLPHISSFAGIPLAAVMRPLDNEYLERLFFTNRVGEGQFMVSKKNALFTLRKSLQKGISIGMLPDQSTAKGLIIDFFGRKATTTPIPALLAVHYKRPIVVTACCRRPGDYRYEAFVGDPIMPGEYTSEKEEIIRITEEMTREMERVIRKYPEQYLWIHNRWKTYKGKKEFLA